jgi:hypothetical protein
MERVGNNDRENCVKKCEAESKPSGNAHLFRWRIPSGVMKSWQKVISAQKVV